MVDTTPLEERPKVSCLRCSGGEEHETMISRFTRMLLPSIPECLEEALILAHAERKMSVHDCRRPNVIGPIGGFVAGLILCSCSGSDSSILPARRLSVTGPYLNALYLLAGAVDLSYYHQTGKRSAVRVVAAYYDFSTPEDVGDDEFLNLVAGWQFYFRDTGKSTPYVLSEFGYWQRNISEPSWRRSMSGSVGRIGLGYSWWTGGDLNWAFEIATPLWGRESLLLPSGKTVTTENWYLAAKIRLGGY